MKTIGIIFSIMLICLFTSCEKDKWHFVHLESEHQIEACGAKDPLNELSWLRNLIMESINDPNFISFIWVKEYNQEDIFVVQYSVSSVAYYYFNCDGKKIDMGGDLSVARTINENLMRDPTLLYLAEKIKH